MRAALKVDRFQNYQDANRKMKELDDSGLDHTHHDDGHSHFVMWAELDAESPEKQLIAEIVNILSGNEWSPDTPEFIAEVLKENGYEILEPNAA